MAENTKYFTENFMNDFIEKVVARFRIMKKYSQDEGIKLIPMDKLEKSPRFDDFICNFSIGRLPENGLRSKGIKNHVLNF